MKKDKYGNISQENLQKELDEIIGKGKTETEDVGENFEIYFVESKRYYELNQNGDISEYKTVVEDKFPGNIAKDRNGNNLDGNTEPYEINCIEDLVALSNISNGKGNYIDAEGNIVEASFNTFSGKNIVLTQSLNFNSKRSYADLSIMWSYDEENDAYIIDENSNTTLKEIITDKDGVGFVPIGPDTGSGNLMFAGNLDGEGFEIKNIYENRSGCTGLFRTLYKSIIRNLGITGEFTSIGNSAGGISGVSLGGKFYNCYNLATINSKKMGGGIVGSAMGNLTIINCYNGGSIKGNSDNVGGLVGYNDINSTCKIINSYNIGTLKSSTNKNANGILGGAYNTGSRIIINSCSLGKILSTAYTFYYSWGGATVELDHCYYLGTIVNGTDNIYVNEGASGFLENSEEILEQLNNYVEEHKSEYDIPLKAWKIGENLYPILEK